MSDATTMTAAEAKAKGNPASLVGVAILALLGYFGGGLLAAGVIIFALFGTPLFTILGGSSMLAFLSAHNIEEHYVRNIAGDILDEVRFLGSPVLITIPLFTFVGYVMAESKTPDRIVRASQAFFGWMPGGLAIVCIVASAFFTALTGGSGVTIVAIGGLLYPALRKQGYSDAFSLGLITTGGSLGLLLPPSLPILVYSLIARVDMNKTFRVGLVPGLLVMAILAVYAAFVGIREGVKREPFVAKEAASALWMIKWELLIPVVILGGLGSGLTNLEESAALAAFYTFAIEVFIYKDLEIRKDLPRIAKSSMALAGAVILILSMANALVSYLIDHRVPQKAFEAMTHMGIVNLSDPSKSWQFLLILNVFLLVLGMVMDGFSAIIVAVPLIIPFAAAVKMEPFHLAMIFLLNLEVAYCCPPLGLNLFIASFRFNRPVVSLYKIVVPFMVMLTGALMLITYVPSLSTFTVSKEVKAARAQAEAATSPDDKYRILRDTWLLECVQEDTTNPQPCSKEDMEAYPHGQMPVVEDPNGPKAPSEEDLMKDFGE